MPAYDYFCPQCNAIEEKWHGMSEEPDIMCDKCKTKMKKAYTGITYHLKGMGWASKDTATAGKPKRVKETIVGVPEIMKDTVSNEVKSNAAEIRRSL